MGRYLAFCSSVPWVRMGSQHRPLWVATMSPVEAHCLDSSSMQMALARGSAPAPPYSLGTHMPMTPRLNSFSMFSRGYWLVLSVSAAMGLTSFSVNSAIIFRISWCSRLRLKSMIYTPLCQILKRQFGRITSFLRFRIVESFFKSVQGERGPGRGPRTERNRGPGCGEGSSPQAGMGNQSVMPAMSLASCFLPWMLP